MGSKIFNLYVRIKDESSDRGWTPMWFANAPNFDAAMRILEDPNLDSLDIRHYLALTVNEEGGVYDPKEKTLALGRLFKSGKIGIISDEECSLPGKYLPAIRSYVGASYNWLEFWRTMFSPSETIDVLDRTRYDDGRLIAGISAEVLSYAIVECRYTNKDYSNIINAAKAYSRYEIEENEFVNLCTLPPKVLDARPIDLDYLIRESAGWIAAVNSKSVTHSVEAIKKYTGDTASRATISGNVIRVMKQHLTLAMILEDIMFL